MENQTDKSKNSNPYDYQFSPQILHDNYQKLNNQRVKLSSFWLKMTIVFCTLFIFGFLFLAISNEYIKPETFLNKSSEEIPPEKTELGIKFEDPDNSTSISIVGIREFVQRAHSHAINNTPASSSASRCEHEYIQNTVERYKHELTCVADGDFVRASAPYRYGLSSYCVDSNGFNGLVINTHLKSGISCLENFLPMEPFNPNQPNIERILSFKLPEFERVFSNKNIEQDQYEKLKQYYRSMYSEQTYLNNYYGISFVFPTMFVNESSRESDRSISLTPVEPERPGTFIDITILESQNKTDVRELKKSDLYTEVKNSSGYILSSKASSIPHNSQADTTRANSFRTSTLFWSSDGNASPLRIDIKTLHSSQYDEIDFAYAFKYHEFIKEVIIESLLVDEKIIYRE